jgi:uncharacterized OB-fold protein
MNEDGTTELLLASEALRRPKGGDPFLEGMECEACHEVLVGDFAACPACGARGQLKPRQLGVQGRLLSFTIVHRSFPGVPTPFVSAVVALDGGGILKGNLVGVDPTPDGVRVGQAIGVRICEAPRPDAQGRRYLAYEFTTKPAGELAP